MYRSVSTVSSPAALLKASARRRGTAVAAATAWHASHRGTGDAPGGGGPEPLERGD